jgi:hypothetical protein
VETRALVGGVAALAIKRYPAPFFVRVLKLFSDPPNDGNFIGPLKFDFLDEAESMQHRNSKYSADEGVTGSSSENSDNMTRSEPQRPSAIERQKAATSKFSSLAAGRSMPNGTAYPKTSYFGVASFLILFFIAAAALALLFTDLGRSLPTISGVMQSTAQAVSKDSVPATHVPAAVNSSIGSSISSSRTANPKTVGALQTSANISQTDISADASSTALSIPAAEVSLRNRPELLKQLVQIYRSQLTDDPNNSTARTALDQLQEQSLTELQAIVLEGDEATAIKTLEVFSRLFPEAADNARYKYLVARTDHFARQIKEEPVAKPKPLSFPAGNPSAINALATNASAINSSATGSLRTTSPTTIAPTTAAPEKNISSAIKPSTTGDKEAAANAASTKPEIRALSMTPGTMVGDSFVPGDEGNFFMVEISYRNFSRVSEDANEPMLIARLGIPEDSSVLAEVPVEILGDRGKKSFVIANMMPGNIGGKYRLNFILNGEFLASSRMRVSMPEQ